MDQDRHPGVARHLEDRLRGGVAEAEGLGARVQLDAARAEAEAALRLADRVVGRVQAAVGEQAAAGLRGPGEDPVVGGAVGRVALGVVQREDAGRGVRADLVELPEQAREVQRPPVLVEAEMGVGVDDPAAGWAERLELGAERRDRRGLRGTRSGQRAPGRS
ncbi:hypothetical protein FSW04_01870 [Baekduia soli]|uniref:Uncharacterized protein n=1 Tax=Baekduia soli TaxID=496014 RepID=A0A5B8U0E0_9ACTN|nr:hypothetical protein FSW04_01870 [Baekduia soli]